MNQDPFFGLSQLTAIFCHISRIPSSIILPGYQADKKAAKVGKTFTGEAFLDRIYSGDEQNISNVTFMPCARTY
jgi:hypothetical protein